MQGRAAAQDEDPLVFPQLIKGKVEPPQLGGRLLQIEAAPEGVADGFRLLENFLPHEVRMGTLVAGGDSIINFFHMDGLLSERGGHIKAVRMEGDHLLVLEDHDPVGIRGEGLGVAGEKVFPVAHADHEGAAPPGSHDQPRQFRMNHRDAQGSLDLLQGSAHRIDQALLALVLAMLERLSDQVSENFRVGVGNKFMASLDQALL